MGFHTKSEAKHAAENMQRKLQEGYDQSNIMLKDYLEFWLRVKKSED